MKAVIHTQYGPVSSSIKVSNDFPIPTPGPRQLLLRVHASAINPVDYKLVLGYLSLFVSRKFPFVPGFDVSGVVIAKGAKCTSELKVGDEVWGDLGLLNGSFAEFVAVKEELVAPKPTNLTFAQAASVPLAALTSLQALTYGASLEAGQRVLVIGGAGGTGVFGIQIAKAIGAYVATTASARNIEFVQQQGADRVLDYTLTGDQHWIELLKSEIKAGTTPPFDAIYGCAGGIEEWHASPFLLKKGGSYVTITGDAQGKATVGGALKIGAGWANRWFWGLFGQKIKYTYWITKTDGWKKIQKDYSQLKQWFEEGKLRAVVEKQFELDEAVALFEAAQAGKARGKLVLNVSTEANQLHERVSSESAKETAAPASSSAASSAAGTGSGSGSDAPASGESFANVTTATSV